MRKLIEEARALLGTEWIPVYGPHVGLVARAHIAPVASPLPTMPFRTDTARKVFQYIPEIVVDYPEEGARAVVARAMDAAGLSFSDVTPEDVTLLTLATEYLQNGPPPSVSRRDGAIGRNGA